MLRETARLLDRPAAPAPSIVVDETRARANIAAMARKAALSGVRFRPHFKTHQNVGVGRWFAEAGVRCATVSSLPMAERFARAGWNDLMLAILIDPRELPRLAELAGRLAERGGALHLAVDTPEAARAVRHVAGDTAPLWLKVDTGAGRSGVPWDDTRRLRRIADSAAFRGVLAHAGHAYRAPRAALPALFAETAARLAAAREATGRDLEISVGDTPTCTVVERFDGVDEVRPGNFVFFDLMQRAQGVCGDGELAAAVACPVLALDRAAGRIVLRGGAVHLSKERLETAAGPVYGCLGTAGPGGFGRVVEEAPLVDLSQEHGLVRVAAAHWDAVTGGLRTGDRVPVFPVHSCLACDLHDTMITLGGTPLPRDADGERT